MPRIESKVAIIKAELETVENTMYMHELRVECGQRTNDEKLVKANQEAIVKLIAAKCFLEKKLAETEMEKVKLENADSDTGSDGSGPCG